MNMIYIFVNWLIQIISICFTGISELTLRCKGKFIKKCSVITLIIAFFSSAEH